ncbi:MAG: PAS domain S-box protein, partial [Proteobacteria bacterium]|nr:PAS domain S-box protein [Pseudomonadota bacterium]
MTGKETSGDLKNRILELEQENDALRQSEKKYRDLIENIPDAVYSLDAMSRVSSINIPAAGFYGYTPEDLMGHDFSTFIHPDDQEKVVNSFIEAIESLRQWTTGLRFRVIAKDGSCHWVELNSHMHFDENGNYHNEEGVLRNIDERVMTEQALIEIRSQLEKRVEERTAELKEANKKLLRENEDRKRVEKELRESEKRFRELADFLPQPVYEMDTWGKLKYMSNIGYEMTGYSKDELKKIGHLADIFHPDERERFYYNMQMLFSGKKIPANEYTLISKDGSFIPLILHAAP